MVEFRDGRCVYSHCAGALVERNGFVLLEASADGYTIPGARVDLLQPSARAIEHRLWDQVRVPVTVSGLLWVVERFFDHRSLHVHQTLFVYGATLGGSVPSQRLRRHKLGWWPVSVAARMRLHPEFLRDRLDSPPGTVEYVCLT